MAQILLVEDDATNRDATTRVLVVGGHKVVGVANGREALVEVMRQQPDVILLDLAMPEMDGPSFLEVLRSYLRLQSLPVVVLTGLSDSPMIERVQTLKVNCVLLKGKAIGDDIFKAIEEALVRHPN
jgi:CheY-like chemotaxis protein